MSVYLLRMGLKSHSTKVPHRNKWSQNASCAATSDDRSFFPGKGRPPKIAPYTQYCDGCPVMALCLNWAIVHQPKGVWGGLTEAERARLPFPLRDRLVRESQEQGWYEPVVMMTADDLVSAILEQRETLKSVPLTPVSNPHYDPTFRFDFEIEEEQTVQPVIEEPTPAAMTFEPLPEWSVEVPHPNAA